MSSSNACRLLNAPSKGLVPSFVDRNWGGSADWLLLGAAALLLVLAADGCVAAEPKQPSVSVVRDTPAEEAFVVNVEMIPLGVSFPALADSLAQHAGSIHARVRSKDDQRIVLVLTPNALVEARASAGQVRVKSRFDPSSEAANRVAKALRTIRSLASGTTTASTPPADAHPLPALPNSSVPNPTVPKNGGSLAP